MKITTWNVNGIRAALKNEADNWWRTCQPDVLCLQEIRARLDQLTNAQREALETENMVWNPAERAGYSGVATLSTLTPNKSITGLGIPRFDQEGRVIQTVFPDFRIFNLYYILFIR